MQRNIMLFCPKGNNIELVINCLLHQSVFANFSRFYMAKFFQVFLLMEYKGVNRGLTYRPRMP